MRYRAGTLRNPNFSESYLKRFRKQSIYGVSETHLLDSVGDYHGTQYEKSVYQSDGTGKITSAHITNQTVIEFFGTATLTVTPGEIQISSGWVSNIKLSDGTIYYCEERLGTIVCDASGSGNHGDLIGGITHTTIRDILLKNYTNEEGYNLASSFNGVSSYVDVQQSQPSVTGYITGQFLCKNSVQNGQILSNRDNSSDYFHIASSGGDSHLMQFRIKSGSTNMNLNSSVAGLNFDNNLHNFKCVFDGTKSELWVDDVLVDSSTELTSLPINSNNLYIGQRGNGAGFFQGIIRNIKWYDINDNLLFSADGKGENDWSDGTLVVDVDEFVVSTSNSNEGKDAIFNENLQFAGKVASDLKMINSNCLLIGSTSAHLQANFSLIGVGILNQNGDADVVINESNNRIEVNTIGTCYNIVLSDGSSFNLAEGLGVVCYAREDENKTFTLSGDITWSTQDEYHANTTQGFSGDVGVKKPFKISGYYTNPPVNGHNNSETNLEMEVFRENLSSSELHYNQGTLDSKVINYGGIGDNLQVFRTKRSNLKIDIETFIPGSILFKTKRFKHGFHKNQDSL